MTDPHSKGKPMQTEARQWRGRHSWMVLALVLAMVMTACGGGTAEDGGSDTTDTGTDGAETTENVPGVTEDQINIVSTTGLSGNFAVVTGPYVAAVNTVLDRVNEAGGVHGRQINWEPVDDGFDVQRAVTAAQRFARSGDVFAAAFPFGTNPTIAKAPIYEQEGIPYFEFGTFHGLYTESTPPTTFGCVTPYYFQSRAAVSYVRDNLEGERWGSLVYAADDGHEVSQALRDEAEAGGIEIVAEQEYEPGTTDFSGQLSTLSEANLDHLLVYGSVPDSARVAEAANRAGLEATLVGPMTVGDPQFVELVGDIANGVIAGLPSKHLDFDDPAIEKFKEELTAYDDSIDHGLFALLGYHCAEVFVEVLNQAGPDLTRESLVAAFESMENFETGIGAPVSYGPDDHVGGTAAIVAEIQDGVYVDVSGGFIEVGE